MQNKIDPEMWEEMLMQLHRSGVSGNTPLTRLSNLIADRDNWKHLAQEHERTLFDYKGMFRSMYASLRNWSDKFEEQK